MDIKVLKFFVFNNDNNNSTYIYYIINNSNRIEKLKKIKIVPKKTQKIKHKNSPARNNFLLK